MKKPIVKIQPYMMKNAYAFESEIRRHLLFFGAPMETLWQLEQDILSSIKTDCEVNPTQIQRASRYATLQLP